MSEDKIKRRRFLADILFAGGAISAAALLAKATQMGARPEPATAGAVMAPVSPPTPTPNAQLDGDVVAPQVRATRQPEPVLGGKPMAPQPQVKGDVAVPRQQPKP